MVCQFDTVHSELQMIAVYSRSFRSPLQVPTPQAGTSASSQSSEQVKSRSMYTSTRNRYEKSMHYISHAGARIVVVFAKVCERDLKSGMYVVRATSHFIVIVDPEAGGTENRVSRCDKVIDPRRSNRTS
jgi:hypothetical protein